MTTATSTPSVRLPMGTMGFDWVSNESEMPYRLDWASSGSSLPYRFVFGINEAITDDISVRASACQFADGSIDDGSIVEAPAVFVNGEPVPNERVHALISVLQNALAQVEEWQTLSAEAQ
jgi:hypothetical protein